MENNSFIEMTGPAMEASAFKILIIRNNHIINKGKAPIVLTMRSSIRVEYGNSLIVEGNDWTTQKGIESPGLLYDAGSTSKIICGGNQLHAE